MEKQHINIPLDKILLTYQNENRVKLPFRIKKWRWAGFGKLPVKTSKRFLSLVAVLCLAAILPVAVWAVVTLNFNPFEKAASRELVSTSRPHQIFNKVRWSTEWASFSAVNFEIQTSNGKVFRVNPSKPCNNVTGQTVCVSSNSPFLNSEKVHYMTLEVVWFEQDTEMRMFIYLYSDGVRWWSEEIRVYNGQPSPNADWIFYRGRFFDTPIGQPFIQSAPFELTAIDPLTKDPVFLRFSNVEFSAFLNYFYSPTPTPTPIPLPTPFPFGTPIPSRIPRPTPTPIGGAKGDLCPEVEACPVPGQPNLLRNCHPPEEGNKPRDILCNLAGRIESCGEQKFCCPGAGQAWTTQMAGLCVPPSPVLSPAPTPIRTYIPSPIAIASPISTNQKPIILTSRVPVVWRAGSYYTAPLDALDNDPANMLVGQIAGLPQGLNYRCNSQTASTQSYLSCEIYGIPTKTGLYRFLFVVNDGKPGGIAEKSYFLAIIRNPFSFFFQ